jgi:uncharacterized repeat protein (TIGR01451 family)
LQQIQLQDFPFNGNPNHEKEKTMKKLHFGLAAVGVMMFATSALAATNAGVTISNQATAQYTVDANSYTVSSPITTFKVAQIVNISVANMDVTTVAVGSGDTGKATTFKITNLGNGPDTFVLTVDSNVAGDQFNPTFTSIVIDTNGDGANNAGDTTYVSGSPLALAAGESVTVFVLNDMPALLTNNDIGLTQLKAQSVAFNTGDPGTVFAGFGVGGVDAVLGVKDGAANAQGIYKASTVSVTLSKSSVILDPWNGNQPVPGATVTYTIVSHVTGAGTATGLKIIDPIPANTTYKFNSMKRNGVALTDALGDDAGEATPTEVTITLGDVVAGTPDQTVSFQVTIN